MAKFIANKTLAPVRAGQASPSVPSTYKAGRNEVLAREIIKLFSEDQALLAELQNAKKNPAFRQSLESYVDRSKVKKYNPNFYDSVVYGLGRRRLMLPRLFVATSSSVRLRIRASSRSSQKVVGRRGPPGDEAAADFLFLFGHDDGDNVWRVTQLPTIKKVFREDHVSPRLYAHLCDRLANVAGKPQIYGSGMGPGDTPGSAKLYWP